MIYNLEEITSRQNPYVSYVCKLSEKKHRENEKKFRFDGVKLLGEAVRCGVELESVLLTREAFEKVSDVLGRMNRKISVKLLSDSVFSKISEEKSPEGVICVAKHIDKIHKIIKIKDEGKAVSDELKDKSVFILESVRDPGNMGTIIRTAAAFGVDFLLISDDCADIYNSKTIRAAMGTLFHQNIMRVDNICAAIKMLSKQGRDVYAATLGREAVLLGNVALDRRDCIAVGNEGHGLSEEAIAACGKKILIPMMPDTESLNAAIASSVCLWEQFGRNISKN